VEWTLRGGRFSSIERNTEKMAKSLFKTSVFWPRVRARALRAHVFLGSITRQKGRCAPTAPVHRSFAASYSSKI